MDLVNPAQCFAAVLLLVLAHTPASAENFLFCGTHQWQPLIEDAAARFNIPSQWIHSVMRAESAGCAQTNGQPTVSTAGAMGLMQLMPTTWQTLQGRLHLGDNPHDPRDNILAGAAYLSELYERYGLPGAFAAYHAGPSLYEDHLTSGRALPGATLEYLARVQKTISPSIEGANGTRAANTASPRPPFIPLRHVARSDDSSADLRDPRSPFVPLQRTSTAVMRAVPGAEDVQPK